MSMPSSNFPLHCSFGDQQRRDVRRGRDDNVVLLRRRRQGLGQAEKVPKEPQEPGTSFSTTFVSLGLKIDNPDGRNIKES